MWKNLPATRRSRDTAHAQWLQTHCKWYPMGDIRTHNSRTYSRRIFKLGEGVDHVTCHGWPLTKVKKVKSQSHKVTKRISSNNAYNSVTDGRINFKLGRNFRREVCITWYFLGQWVNQTGSRNMAHIQLIQCKNQHKTSSNRRNIVPYKDIGVKESNGDFRILTRSS